MFNLVPEKIDRYIEGHYLETDKVLSEMEQYGMSRKFPLVGPQVGRLLFILTKLVKASRVLEIGSGYGYSAYWFAKALPASGKVVQTEYSKENSDQARDFFTRGGLLKKTELHTGDGLELIAKIGGPVDILFLDLDKKSYAAALEKDKPLLKTGGLVIADNTLWSGQAADPSIKDEDTEGIRRFNKKLFSDPDFFTTILPVRDGVAVGLRIH